MDNAIKLKRETAVSQRLIIFALMKYKQLTSEQRYTIFVLLQKKMKKKDIAKSINVSPSTLYRELKRNSGSRNHYNWETAEANARQKKHKKPGNRSISTDVRDEAVRLLKESNGLQSRFPAICIEKTSSSLQKAFIVLYARTRKTEVIYTRTAVIG